MKSPINNSVAGALLALSAGILAWEGAALAGLIDLSLFPPPSRIWTYLQASGFDVGIGFERSSIFETVFASVVRVVLGLVIAFVAAMVLGIAMMMFAPARIAIDPFLRLLAPIAPIAWVPFGLALFGVGNTAAVFLVFLAVIFVLTLGIVTTIENMPEEFRQIARTFGASKTQTWGLIIMPYILPRAFILLRANFFGAWMAVLSAEMVGLKNGLGAMIMVGRESANMQLVFLGMILIGLTGAMFDLLMRWIQVKFLWWAQEEPWK
jgi:NitT/TauT family transport system permease protein